MAGMKDRAFDFPQTGVSRFGLIIFTAVSNHLDPVMDTAVNSPGIVIVDRCVLPRFVYIQPNGKKPFGIDEKNEFIGKHRRLTGIGISTTFDDVGQDFLKQLAIQQQPGIS